MHLVPLPCSLDWTPPLQEREQGDQAVAAVSWLGPTNTAEDTSNCNIGRFRVISFMPLATEFRFSGEVRVWKYEMRCDEEVPRLLISNFGNHHSGISIISYYHHLLIRGFMPETLEVVYLTKIIYNAEPQNCEL